MPMVSLSNQVWTLLKGPTVLVEMEREPTQEPGKVADRLFAKASVQIPLEDCGTDNQGEMRRGTEDWEKDISPEDTERAVDSLRCPRRPSDLFLKVSAGNWCEVWLKYWASLLCLGLCCHAEDIGKRPIG